VAIQVSRTSSTWATAADDDDDECLVGGGVSSALTYESFRGPPTVVQSSPCVRRGRADDGERTPTNDDVDDDEASPRHSRDDVIATSTSSPVTSCQASSPVTSPTSPRPRPQIAPKPRLDLRRRRASAGESTTTADDDDDRGPSATSRHDVGSSPSSPLSPQTTPAAGVAMLASVMAAASSQRMSERCRLAQSPSSGRRAAGAAADSHVNVSSTAVSAAGNCARPSSASALSRTAAAVNASGSNVGRSQTLRTHNVTGTSSSTSLGSAKKLSAADDQTVSSVRTTTSPGDSPRRSSSTVPPPVPPKHPSHSFSAAKRSPDVAGQPSVVASPSSSSSSSSSGSAAPVKGRGVGNSPAVGDTGTLPFANENVGTIRQRGNVVVSAEQQPAASVTTVNGDVATASGTSVTFTSYLSLGSLRF